MTKPPWGEVPAGHVAHPHTMRRVSEAETPVGAYYPDNGSYSTTQVEHVKFPINRTSRALCEDPASNQWLGYVYAAIAQVGIGASFDDRRAFARAGVNALFMWGRFGGKWPLRFSSYNAKDIRGQLEAAAKYGNVPASMRTTFAGLRDSMTLPALTHLLIGAVTPDHLLKQLAAGKTGHTSVGKCEFSWPNATKDHMRRLADLRSGNVMAVLESLPPDEHGNTPLHYIAMLGNSDMAEIANWVSPKFQAAAYGALVRLVAKAQAFVRATSTTTATETEHMTTLSKTTLEEAYKTMTDGPITDGVRTLSALLKHRHAGESEAPSAMSDIQAWITGELARAAKALGKPEPDPETISTLAGLVTVCRTGSAWDKLDVSGGDLALTQKIMAFDALHEGSTAEATERETSGAAATTKRHLEADPRAKAMLDAVLGSAGLPNLDAIEAMIVRAEAKMADATAEVERLRKAASVAKIAPTSVAASGPIPSGKTVTKTAAEVFKGAQGLSRSDLTKLAKLEVPVFEWDGVHPDVPLVDEDYIYRMDSLLPLLFALVSNDRPWVQGHTGSGKSTLVAQVAARLGWPLLRVNLDSEISRLDLVGRDTLTTDPTSGATVTKWVDGVLPKALRGPNILLLDEIDFVRPDVAYVLQPMLEGNSLVLNENGGERVVPHVMSRIVATANTVGQGDEFGMYQGARPQSSAMLDRFTTFIKVPYLSTEQEVALVKAKFPAIPAGVAETIGRFVTEHREAFTKASILMPLSPRGVGALAGAFLNFFNVLGNEKQALNHAFESTLLAKASEQDRAVIAGLLKRVLK